MKLILLAVSLACVVGGAGFLIATAQPLQIELVHYRNVTERGASIDATFECGARNVDLSWGIDPVQGMVIKSVSIDGNSLLAEDIDQLHADLELELDKSFRPEYLGASLALCDERTDSFVIGARKRHVVGNITMITEYWMSVGEKRLVLEEKTDYIAR